MNTNATRLVQQSITEMLANCDPENRAAFERTVAKTIFAVLKEQTGFGDMPVQEITGMGSLSECLPFRVFPVAAVFRYSHLIDTLREPAVQLRQIAARSQLYLGDQGYLIVVASGRQLVAVHNLPDLNISGRIFPLFDKTDTVLYVDPLRPLLEAIRRTDRLFECAWTASSPGTRISPRFAKMPRIVLDVMPALGKGEWQVYFTACLQCDYTTRSLTISQRGLAERAGISQSQAAGALKNLIALGLMQVEKIERRRTTYLLPVKPDGARFIRVPELIRYIPRMSKRQWAVYVCMLSEMSFKSGFLRTTQTALSVASKVHVSHIPAVIKQLEKAGAVAVERHNRKAIAGYWLPVGQER